MSTAGPNFPTSATGNTGAGTKTWSNPTNIEASGGGTADAVFAIAAATSKDLIATGFGFAIPATATISGIQLEVNEGCSNFEIASTTIKLLKAGSPVGNNKAGAPASGVEWNSPASAAVYGTTSDLWGTTWTPADINASNFGAMVTCNDPGGGVGDTATVDYVKITVTYTVPAPTVTSCSPNNGTTAGGTSVTITGTNFFSGTITVTFGGSSATGVSFVNSTTITCTTPAHAAGAVNVVVTNPDSQTGTGTNAYTYNSPTSPAQFFQMF